MSEPVIFILSHNRPDNVKTIKALQRSNSKLDYYIVIDDTDPQLTRYKKNYNNLLIFNKKEQQKRVDSVDNFNEMRTPLYARNFIQEYAKNNNIKYFIELDDDYDYFCFKYPYNGILKELVIQDIDKLFLTFFEVIKNTKDNIYFAFGQNGDYIGGKNNSLIRKGFKFKIMNCFFFKNNSSFKFRGTFNDDVNGYLTIGLHGKVPITIGGYSLHQENTQQFSGGLTDSYLKFGTYVKSFSSVIVHPTGVKLQHMTGARTNEKKHYRIHHKVLTNHVFPKILAEKWKK